MNILLIEDDKGMADDIALTLGAHGHGVEIIDTGTEGLACARTGSHAVIIVDRMLPELDGLSLVRELRSEGLRTPILFLTTMSGIDDRVEGLEGGADDYLTKPFASAELLARVHALVRRADGEATLLKVGGLEMDLIRRTVTRHGRPATLQAQEFRLLELLMANADHVVPSATILDSLWGREFAGDPGTIAVHVLRLRKKLERWPGASRHLRTVRGLGYVFDTEPVDD